MLYSPYKMVIVIILEVYLFKIIELANFIFFKRHEESEYSIY